jgi:hypothetical protein
VASSSIVNFASAGSDTTINALPESAWTTGQEPLEQVAQPAVEATPQVEQLDAAQVEQPGAPQLLPRWPW